MALILTTDLTASGLIHYMVYKGNKYQSYSQDEYLPHEVDDWSGDFNRFFCRL
jgi:hypothetical protein